MSRVENLSSQTAEFVEYLRQHPDFFLSHPELLATLSIPHLTEKNTASIIEYQVARLRQQFMEQQKLLQVQEDRSAATRKFSADIHALVLEMLAATTPAGLYQVLRKNLMLYYAATRVVLLIFSSGQNVEDTAGLRFMPVTSKLRFMFAGLFHLNKPLCGSLQEEHLMALFGTDLDSIQSTVILPLVRAHQPDQHWQGLLVLGSSEENRYGHGLELDLLVFIKDILYLMLEKFLHQRVDQTQSA